MLHVLVQEKNKIYDKLNIFFFTGLLSIFCTILTYTLGLTIADLKNRNTSGTFLLFANKKNNRLDHPHEVYAINVKL